MESNENSGINTSFTYSSPQQPQHQPPSTLSPPSAATNGGNSEGTAASVPLYPHTVAGKAPIAAAVEPQRRRRGRPRKYGTPEAAAAARRAAVPAAVRRRAYQQQQQLFLSGGGSLSHSSPGGQGFTPHVISVAAGEDVSQKIMLFLQQNRRELCILSASGSITTASLRQPATSGGNITYEGDFEIITLAGSYVHTDQGGKAGGFSVCLSSAKGEIVGGGVGGPLIAKGSVEIIVATFSIDPKENIRVGLKGDASVNKMSSPAASSAVYRPVVEASGGFCVTGSDDHHNMEGSTFMSPTQWRGGLNYDLAGTTGHRSHDSSENGDYEQIDA